MTIDEKIQSLEEHIKRTIRLINCYNKEEDVDYLQLGHHFMVMGKSIIEDYYMMMGLIWARDNQ